MSKTAIPDRIVVYDLASATGRESETLLENLHWPTHYSDYHFVSTGLVEAVASSAREAATSPELNAVTEAKLYDVVTDLAVIARLALDLSNVRSKGCHLLYGPTDSAWLHFLQTGQGELRGIARHARWHHAKPRGFVPEMKRALRRWHSRSISLLSSREGRHDILSRNLLLNRSFATSSAGEIDISPNYWNWPTPEDTPRQVHELVDTVLSAFVSAVRRMIGGDSDLEVSAGKLAREVISFHMGKAWSDLEKVQRLVTKRNAGAVLVGGTPKHIGRLFGWHYQRLDREVIRFAHGGERAFFDDHAWGLAEFPYCNTYVCHNDAEARHVERRRTEGRMVAAGPSEMQFRGPHLGAIMQRNRVPKNTPPGRRNGKVMYVPGGYLGEDLGDFPSRKPPDVLYLDWQIWVLKSLRSQGYRITTKVHPRGIFSESAILGGYSDEIIGGYFGSGDFDVDCFIFDFAGTAFIDALATDKGIVLIDMGTRPFDPYSFSDLASRCEVVRCTLAYGNKFRLDTDQLCEAVESASTMREWPERFFETYCNI